MSILETNGVSKQYRMGQVTVDALAGVDLSIAQGEFVAVMGPSGSGKSTLLHLLGGLDQPTAGNVALDGQVLSALSDRQITITRRRRVGFVFQFYNLIVIIAVLGVTNTMMMNVLERVREIGCLRAVGMTRGQVVRMVLAEALIVGLLGGLFGVAFGAYASFFAVKGMVESTGWELPFVLPATSLLIGLAVALGVSQVASLYPAWRAAKTNIVRAVQYE